MGLEGGSEDFSVVFDGCLICFSMVCFILEGINWVGCLLKLRGVAGGVKECFRRC